jgi:hypothetical protein
VRPGELISEEPLERWQKRGLMGAMPLRGGTGLAPLREENDVVRVEGGRPIE